MTGLHSYVQDILEPTYQQTCFIPSRINSIANVLKRNSALSLDRVIPGGSYEKGTMLRYKADVEVVLVFNKEPGVKRNWRTLMNRVFGALSDAYPTADISPGNNIAVHITFDTQEKVNFDVVASYHVNSPRQMAGVKTCKIYQGISSLWHLEYIRPRKNLPYFTNTVRLLKDWKNEHEIPLKSFHMELIATSAYRWRGEGCHSLEDYVRVCFQEIQSMTDGSPIYPVDWEYFDDADIASRNDYPLLIDPANPANNLLEGISDEAVARIRAGASRAITLIGRAEYGPIFDPQNKTGTFAVAS